MRWILGCLLICQPAWALDLWVKDHPARAFVVQAEAKASAKALSQVLNLDVTHRTYLSDNKADLLTASGLAVIDGWDYPRFESAGWTAIARLPRASEVNLYRLPEQNTPLFDVGTPGPLRIEHALAPALAPQADRLVTFSSTEGCLRRLFVDIDGCLARAGVVRAYEQRFNVTFKAEYPKGHRLPGAVLMQRGTNVRGADLVGLRVQGQGLVKWNDFDSRFYHRLMAAVERTKTQTADRIIVTEYAYNPTQNGDNHDPIRAD